MKNKGSNPLLHSFIFNNKPYFFRRVKNLKRSVLLFVYGTLLKGEINEYMMQDYKLIEDHVWLKGKLYDPGVGYPFLMLNTLDKVYGELYELPMESLSLLDAFEDFEPGRKDNLYERVKVIVRKENQEWEAFVYIGNQPEMLINEIGSSSWKDYRKK